MLSAEQLPEVLWSIVASGFRFIVYFFCLYTALGILRMLFASDLDCDACGCARRAV